MRNSEIAKTIETFFKNHFLKMCMYVFPRICIYSLETITNKNMIFSCRVEPCLCQMTTFLDNIFYGN